MANVKSTDTLVSLDIGTSKVLCLVADIDEKGDLRIVGIGSGSGRNKALEAAVAAINSSLLQNSEQLGSVKIDQARGCLLIVKGDKDMSIEDVTSASEIIGDYINQEADIMVRTVLDESMKGEIKVMVLLTKFSETSPIGKNLTNRDNLKNRIVASKKYIDDRAVG